MTLAISAALPGAQPDQALGLELPERGIDLPVALVPEVTDARCRFLPDVVAGHRVEAQHPQNRERRGPRAADHISKRYISIRYKSRAESVPLPRACDPRPALTSR